MPIENNSKNTPKFSCLESVIGKILKSLFINIDLGS